MGVRAKIIGTGMYVPNRVVTNDDLAKLMDTSDEWIQKRSGIRERRHIDPGQTPVDLAHEAAVNALRAADLEATELDCIVHIVAGVRKAKVTSSVDPRPGRIVDRAKPAREVAIGPLEGAALHESVLTAVDTYHKRTGQLPRILAGRFTRKVQGSLSARLLREPKDELRRAVDTTGNAARGEHIFRRKALACTACHGIGPVGPAIGPNLVAVGAAAQTAPNAPPGSRAARV